MYRLENATLEATSEAEGDKTLHSSESSLSFLKSFWCYITCNNYTKILSFSTTNTECNYLASAHCPKYPAQSSFLVSFLCQKSIQIS